MHPLTPAPTREYETLILEKVKLAVQQHLSKSMLEGIDITAMRSIADLTSNSIVQAFEGVVWSDPSQKHEATHEIVTEPVFASWKHHLLFSLPAGSFRRRFLSYFWEIEDSSPKRYKHVVSVYVPAVLPEMQRKFPADMGRLHFPISVNSTSGPYT